MELDDLKYNWQKSNQLLDSKLIVNSEVLNKRNLKRSKNEMHKPLLHEIANIIVVSLTVVAIVIGSIAYVSEIRFSIPGFLAALIGTSYVYLAVIKANRISKIDFFNSTIIEIQKEISYLYLVILKFRKLELIMFPLFIIAILPLTFKYIQNRDIYNDLFFFLFEITFIVGFGIIGILWINRNLYDKKITKVQLFLKEMKDIEHFMN